MIIPAILENSIDEIQKKINLVSGLVDRIQIDIYDGIFGNEITSEPGDLLELDLAELSLDIHLMTVDPIVFLADCLELKKKVQNLRIIGQIERMSNQEDFISQAHSVGCSAGLALDVYTPATSLDKLAMAALTTGDGVLAMSVKAGYSGQYFIHRIIEKIKELKMFGNKGSLIIDGGEDPIHIKMSKLAGADQFAVGSWLWEHKDIALAIKELNKFVE